MTSSIHTPSSRQPLDRQIQIDETALAIFDSRVNDLPMLLAGLRPGVTAHVLDPERDGIEQISELLQYRSVAAMTLVAHGAPGELQLGAAKLGLNNLDQYAPHLRSWFSSTDASQLILLACQVAAGDAGLEFVEQLADLTKTSVTASAMAIGNGHWPPVAAQTFQQTVLEQYSSTLVLTFQNEANCYLLRRPTHSENEANCYLLPRPTHSENEANCF